MTSFMSSMVPEKLTTTLPQSSATSGLFGGLTNMKRGSEDYAERRQSQNEMVGSGGMVSGWFNQTFKGHAKPADNQNKDTKRGVME